MGTHYFKCKQCGYWQIVETVGEVLRGPCCRDCHEVMKEFQPRQMDIGLFTSTGNFKKNLLTGADKKC